MKNFPWEAGQAASQSRHNPEQFIWMGLMFGIIFWMIDSMIDILWFTDESYIESLLPDGMELYMRLLVSILFIAFGFVVSVLVKENNRLSEYLEGVGKIEQNRYRAFFDSAPNAIIITDGALRIVEMNGEAVRLFGWNPSELLGMQVFEIMLPLNPDPETVSIRDAFASDSKLVARNITKCGRNPVMKWHVAKIERDAGQMGSYMLIGSLLPDAKDFSVENNWTPQAG